MTKWLTPIFLFAFASVAQAQDVIANLRAGLADCAGTDTDAPDPASFAQYKKIAEGEYLRVEFDLANVTADVVITARTAQSAKVIQAFKDPLNGGPHIVLWKVVFSDTFKPGDVDIEVNATVRSPANRNGFCETSSTRVTLLPKKKWTIAVYGDGDDTTLNRAIIENIAGMASAGGNDEMNLIVLHDQRGIKKEPQPPRGNSRLLRIEEPGMFTSYNQGYHLMGCVDYPERTLAGQSFAASVQWVINRATAEVDMSDVATLQQFLLYTEKFHPAERMLLILSDHGSGWQGAESDTDNPGQLIQIRELKGALQALNAVRGKKLELLYFDCCLMAEMDVLSILNPDVHYVIASEAISWGPTIPYDRWFKYFKKHIDDPTKQAAIDFVKNFYPSTVTTAAVFRVTKEAEGEADMASLDAKLEAFCRQALTDPEKRNTDFIVARELCASGDVNVDEEGEFRLVAKCTMDIRNWLEQLSKRPVGASGTPLGALIPPMLNHIDQVQLQAYVHPTYKGKLFGLSIFFPTHLFKRNIEWMNYYYPDPITAQQDRTNIVIWMPKNPATSALSSVTGSWARATDIQATAPAGLKAWKSLLVHDFVPPRVRFLEVTSKNAGVIYQDLGKYQLIEPKPARAPATSGLLKISVTFNEKMLISEPAEVSFGLEEPYQTAALVPDANNGWINDYTWSGHYEIASAETFHGVNRIRISARDIAKNKTDMDYETIDAQPDTRFTFEVEEEKNLCETIKIPDGDFFAYKLKGSMLFGQKKESFDELQIVTPKTDSTLELQVMLGQDDKTIGLKIQDVLCFIPEGSSRPDFLAKRMPLLFIIFHRTIPIFNLTVIGDNQRGCERTMNGSLTLEKCSEEEIAGHFSAHCQLDIWTMNKKQRVQVAKGIVHISGCFRISKERMRFVGINAIMKAIPIARRAGVEAKAIEQEMREMAVRYEKLRERALEAEKKLPTVEELKALERKLDDNDIELLLEEINMAEKSGDTIKLQGLLDRLRKNSDVALNEAKRLQSEKTEALKKELEAAANALDIPKIQELAEKMKRIATEVAGGIETVNEESRQKIIQQLKKITPPLTIRPN